MKEGVLYFKNADQAANPHDLPCLLAAVTLYELRHVISNNVAFWQV